MPIALRTDIDAVAVRAAALGSKDAAQTRRLLALAAIYEGSSRTEAARIGGVTLQIVRDWVLKFNAAGPDGLINRKAPGKSSLLECYPSRGSGRSDRARPDTGSPRYRALAYHRSCADAAGRLFAIGFEGDFEP